MSLTTKVDTSRTDKTLNLKLKAIKDPRPFFRQLKIRQLRQTALTFRSLGDGAGTFRSVTWKPFASQHTRKDGTDVPAWGGVQRVHGMGSVLGRLRPSGKRVTESSKLLQDTGRLRGDAGTVSVINVREMKLATGLPYSVELNKEREFLFWEIPEDLDAARKMAERFIGRA